VTEPESQPVTAPEPSPPTPAAAPPTPAAASPTPAAPPRPHSASPPSIPAQATTSPTPPPPARAVCGNGAVEPGEQCDDGNTSDGDGCSSKCTTEAPARPLAIESRALELQRVSGNTDIQPSRQARAAMLRDGVTSVKAAVRMCVDTAGHMVDSTLTERTGYTEYDSKILEAVHDWQFRPYVLNGTPLSVCSTVEFVYLPK